jgi:predicted nuclease of predicted toxin-antitoxin system
MKLLLDESVPRGLKEHFPPDYEVSTVRENGWASTKNGELLRLASESGFHALVTADKGFEYQHNPKTLPLAIVILHSHRTTLRNLRESVPEIVGLLSGSVEASIHHVYA